MFIDFLIIDLRDSLDLSQVRNYAKFLLQEYLVLWVVEGFLDQKQAVLQEFQFGFL
jgi:hypothetical protein